MLKLCINFYLNYLELSNNNTRTKKSASISAALKVIEFNCIEIVALNSYLLNFIDVQFLKLSKLVIQIIEIASQPALLDSSFSLIH